MFSANTPCPVRNRDLGIDSSAHKPFSARSLHCPEFPMTARVGIAVNGRRPADILLKAWDGRKDLAVDLKIVRPNPVTGRPLRGSAATFL